MSKWERREERHGFGWMGEQWASGRLRLPEAGADFGKGMVVVMVALDEGREVGRRESISKGLVFHVK